VPLEEPINRAVGGPHAALRQQPLFNLRQRQVRFLADQL
jgi:hypothetical protein